MQGNRYVLVSILSFIFIYLLSPSQAIAASGIRINPPNTVYVEENAPPPPQQNNDAIYYFMIENTNDVCDEDVKIDKGLFLNDPDYILNPLNTRGHAEFKGFSRDKNGPFQPSLRFGMEDESCKGCVRPAIKVYFKVSTGEDSKGCDFRGWKLPVTVCDTGEHCFFCCDNYDGDIPCESPTKLTPSIVWKEGAGLAFLPVGEGAINGRVTGPHPIFKNQIVGKDASIIITPITNCVPGQRDGEEKLSPKKTKTDPALWKKNKGYYKVENLKYGQYLVTARIALLKVKFQTVTLSETNKTITIDFIFP